MFRILYTITGYCNTSPIDMAMKIIHQLNSERDAWVDSPLAGNVYAFVSPGIPYPCFGVSLPENGVEILAACTAL